MKIETLTVDFTDEQKRYLEGFTTGLQISRVGRGLGGGNAGKANAEPAGPDAAHIKAQDKVTASGKKLADQEKFKREEHPFDAYPRLKQQALDNAPPNPADNFRWRYYGLFYVAPAQDSYMCRLADPERHPEALAVCRPGRSRRKTVRTVLPRHHAGQSAGARDSAEERGGVDRGHPGSWACARAAPAPTTSATSRARRRPGSIRRSYWIPANMRASGTITSSTIARCTGCRASSTSPSTAPARSPCWKTPTTSRFPRSR